MMWKLWEYSLIWDILTAPLMQRYRKSPPMLKFMMWDSTDAEDQAWVKYSTQQVQVSTSTFDLVKYKSKYKYSKVLDPIK